MNTTQKELIKTEQRILDQLIRALDNALIALDKGYSDEYIKSLKEQFKCLPDVYSDLIQAQGMIIVTKDDEQYVRKVRNELYQWRMVVECTDSRGIEDLELKIGLHAYGMHIIDWKMPVCRHYILDNAAEEYDGVVIDDGIKYDTHYKLLLKRRIDIFFDKVKEVQHLFPSDEAEQIIADSFLQELLDRRASQEFRNIVFSIQKHQGEIIQAPFRQNMIVQGCAGSGKSMIMLHRLPILLYDNPNSLDRNNLYIITPSLAYMQMAENMRIELEIADLKMGTINQYYDYVIQKYGRKAQPYGRIRRGHKLSSEHMQYVYSKGCMDDIKNYYLEHIAKQDIDLSAFKKLLDLPLLNEKRKNKSLKLTPAETIRKRVLEIQEVLNKNDQNIRTFVQLSRGVYNALADIDDVVRYRKANVERSIRQRISEEEKTISDLRSEMKQINRLRHRQMYQNRVASLTASSERRNKLLNELDRVENNQDYFNQLKTECEFISKNVMKMFPFDSEENPEESETADGYSRGRRDISVYEAYDLLERKKNIEILCDNIFQGLSNKDDPYTEYVEGFSSLFDRVLPIFTAYSYPYDEQIIPRKEYQMLVECQAKNESLQKHLVNSAYAHILKKIDFDPGKKQLKDALSCSPYLYLQALYLYQGMPNASTESLITIDEAQNISPLELALIQAINGNAVVFNLFGDVKQHVEGSKGVDSWDEFSFITDFEQQYLNENYRNARQITDFCNQRFNLNMQAINVSGSGVHEISSYADFDESIKQIFQKPKNNGLSCIIVKNQDEANEILKTYSAYRNLLHDMVSEPTEIWPNKWNLMTIDQVKGLEFEAVVAVSGRMSNNEKYIAYTRALDELYVFDDELLIQLEKITEESEVVSKENKPKTSNRPQRKKRASKSSEESKGKQDAGSVKIFFESCGLEVIDNRMEGGHLWVIGERTDIERYIEMAITRFGVSGLYGKSKVTGFRDGWYTKTKK